MLKKFFIFPLALARRPISLVKTRITTNFRPRFFAPNGLNNLKCLLFHSLSHFHSLWEGECLQEVVGMYIDETHGEGTGQNARAIRKRKICRTCQIALGCTEFSHFYSNRPMQSNINIATSRITLR